MLNWNAFIAQKIRYFFLIADRNQKRNLLCETEDRHSRVSISNQFTIHPRNQGEKDKRKQNKVGRNFKLKNQNLNHRRTQREERSGRMKRHEYRGRERAEEIPIERENRVGSGGGVHGGN